MEGQYPAELSALVGTRWSVEKIPQADTGAHPRSAAVQLISGREADAGKFRDDGGWYYVTDGMDRGKVGINCVHTDLRGKSWLSY